MLGKPPTPSPQPESPSRRITDALEPQATRIGPGTRLKGDLESAGPVDVAGTLDGDLKVSGHCRVREGAHVSGRIEATTLVVEGTVDGPSLVAEKIEIGASARVTSNVRAKLVAIADGAFFEGEVRMDDTGAPATPVTFTEKRRPSEPQPQP